MASSAVNKPTNVAERSADIDAKLKLFGIYSAFSKGKVPSVSIHPSAIARPPHGLTIPTRTNKSTSL